MTDDIPDNLEKHDFDYRTLFESLPGLYLIVESDTPRFTIKAVSDAYLCATLTERPQILDRGIFEVFPDNPDDPHADGVSNLRASLEYVIRNRARHAMAIQKYDIQVADGSFEARYWSPVNSPLLGSDGAVSHIIHRVEDVTEFVRREETDRTARQQAEEERYRAELRAADSMMRMEGMREDNSQLRSALAERRRAEEALRQSYDFRDRILESALLGICALDLSGVITLANSCLAELLGGAQDDLTGLRFIDCVPEADQPRLQQIFDRIVHQGASRVVDDVTMLRADGTTIHISGCWSGLSDQGKIIGIVATIQDVTERARLEEQLQQARKLESVGRLAGGIAHDFNNLLTAIIGFSEIAMDHLPAESPSVAAIKNVIQAGERAANLTAQLLAFARKQIIAPRACDLNLIITKLDGMLRRLIGENIELVALLTRDLQTVQIDPGQFEQVLVNLVLNARDAMPDGGKITIETHNVLLDDEYARSHAEVTPGQYVMVSVTDTGSGMDEAVRLHVFEPFFTTKEKGRGTGLGLATVYGIVRQAGGHIWLYSEPGHGASFKIYLPGTAQAVEVTTPRHGTVRATGTETILVVEDEDQVRTLAAAVLRGHGYTVVEAANGNEALDAARRNIQQIAMVLTDVVLPGMSGNQLVEELIEITPHIKVLYCSGYTESTIIHQGERDGNIAFLPKPFTPSTLTRKVREVLDSRPV
jgi:PAS domain S-box-containing protein